MSIKQRLSASVDADLIEAAEQAVAKGQADSVSAWVNDALGLKLAHDRRLEALAIFVAAHESEHGEITAADMQLASRRARARAVTVRGMPGPRKPAASRRTR